jgi:hypothetical protein
MKTKFVFTPTLILCALFSCACTQHFHEKNAHNVRADFRFGSRFYSLVSSATGESYAIKGMSTDYNEPFTILSSDTSGPFKLDSVDVFYEKLNEIRSKNLRIDHHSDAPRVEIYFDRTKIYDSHNWNETFWDIFRPVMMQIPKNYNPFLVANKPFG